MEKNVEYTRSGSRGRRSEAHEQLVSELAEQRADEAAGRAAVARDERGVGVSALTHLEHIFAAVRRALDVSSSKTRSST